MVAVLPSCPRPVGRSDGMRGGYERERPALLRAYHNRRSRVWRRCGEVKNCGRIHGAVVYALGLWKEGGNGYRETGQG